MKRSAFSRTLLDFRIPFRYVWLKSNNPSHLKKGKSFHRVKIHFLTNCVVAIAKLRIAFACADLIIPGKNTTRSMYEKNWIYENIGRATKAKRKKMKYLHIDVEHKQILSPQWNPENVSDEKKRTWLPIRTQNSKPLLKSCKYFLWWHSAAYWMGNVHWIPLVNQVYVKRQFFFLSIFISNELYY